MGAGAAGPLAGGALGGADADYNPLDAVEAYDIEGGSWAAAEPMATPRNGLAAVAGP